jgi:HTH-type transcriptional regulator/antitoxin HigA
MTIRPIRDEDDLKVVLGRLDAIFQAAEHTPEADERDVLVMLVEAYERKHHAFGPLDPVEAIKFRMDQGGLTVKDLEPIIGKSNRVYEVLNRKRPLTLAMIRRLHRSLGIPAEVLIAETASG